MADMTFNREELNEWLGTQPRQVYLTAVTRAALRVLPSVIVGAPFSDERELELFVLNCFYLAAKSLVCIQDGSHRAPDKLIRLPQFESLQWQRGAPVDVFQSFKALRESLEFSNAAKSAERVFYFSISAASWSHEDVYDEVSGLSAGHVGADGVARREIARDCSRFIAGTISRSINSELLESPLWLTGEMPGGILDCWGVLKELLLRADENWQVWIDWYESILSGQISSIGLEKSRAALVERFWTQGPAAVNARIRELIDEYERPEEPKGEPGQAADVQDGVLVLTSEVPKAYERSDELQRSLHELVREKASSLNASLRPLQNQYPELGKVVTAYLKSLEVPLAQLEVSNVWSEGNYLGGLAAAYAKQDIDRTLSEPLEPEIAGKLASLLTDHSGFILGFELGRLLTERADRMRRNGELPESLRQPVLEILSAFRRLRDNVEAETREIIEFTEDVVIQAGWPTGRVAYSAYALTRTLLLRCGRFLIHKGGPVLGAFGGVAALAQVGGDPQLVAVQQFALLFRDHAGAILQFAAGFPELRRWLAHIVDQFDQDSAK
ncbi:hypothetical protein DYI23_07935 [Roseibium polysiphoniae]|uniref:Uncharacterized protein n=1 Tax=Roseibium polysiphoniae TaxID=2571221 RepID=A0A944CBR6_9HYPH|nr:hypothetical protein [Roseibium polysiphoniae]MBS8260144.1 hypothetical protein [Roseibium polysiphoniae]